MWEEVTFQCAWFSLIYSWNLAYLSCQPPAESILRPSFQRALCNRSAYHLVVMKASRKTKNGTDGFPQRWETLQRITAHQVRGEVYLLVSARITSDVSAQLSLKKNKQTRKRAAPITVTTPLIKPWNLHYRFQMATSVGILHTDTHTQRLMTQILIPPSLCLAVLG